MLHSLISLACVVCLAVAAAPAFSAPSSSSSAPSALISDSLPSSLIWGPSTPIPERYPISHLQTILPTCPLFFGSVYADFVFYLILPPKVFSSPRVRSVAHFLLPVLYLGQAMVAAVRAISPLVVQGAIWLTPYVLIELHWFVTVCSSIPNPLTFLLEYVLPLEWLRSVLGTWIVHVGTLAWHGWSQMLHFLYALCSPVRWLNAILSPLLEFIRTEARALWGLSVVFQPLVAALIRLQAELGRLWTGLSTLATAFGSLFSAFMPARIFALFGAVKSGASATAAVGSGLSASGGISRWRLVYQQVLDAAQLIGKWKLLIDRIRLNIQLYYYVSSLRMLIDAGLFVSSAHHAVCLCLFLCLLPRRSVSCTSKMRRICRRRRERSTTPIWMCPSCPRSLARKASCPRRRRRSCASKKTQRWRSRTAQYSSLRADRSATARLQRPRAACCRLRFCTHRLHSWLHTSPMERSSCPQRQTSCSRRCRRSRPSTMRASTEQSQILLRRPLLSRSVTLPRSLSLRRRHSTQRSTRIIWPQAALLCGTDTPCTWKLLQARRCSRKTASLKRSAIGDLCRCAQIMQSLRKFQSHI